MESNNDDSNTKIQYSLWLLITDIETNLSISCFSFTYDSFYHTISNEQRQDYKIRLKFSKIDNGKLSKAYFRRNDSGGISVQMVYTDFFLRYYKTPTSDFFKMGYAFQTDPICDVKFVEGINCIDDTCLIACSHTDMDLKKNIIVIMYKISVNNVSIRNDIIDGKSISLHNPILSVPNIKVPLSGYFLFHFYKVYKTEDGLWKKNSPYEVNFIVNDEMSY